MDTHEPTEIRSLGPGRTVDTGDQLASPVLLGIAAAGAAAAAAFLTLLVA